MYKIDLPIAQCVAGMTTADPIIDLSTGIIIIGKEQMLTDSTISNLKKFKISTVCIYINGWNNIWNVSTEVLSTYENHKTKLKYILEDLRITQVLDIEALRTIATDIRIDYNANYTILACINMVRLADEQIYTHSMNVSLLSMLIGKWMKYTTKEIEALILIGLVHDIGLDKMPDKAWQKYSDLTEESFEQIKKQLHLSIIQKSFNPDHTFANPLESNLGDDSYFDKISKVLSIADIYDVMTTHQLNSKKQSPFHIMELMQKGAFGELDPTILLTFITNIANYYIGVYVVLSTGDIGEVVFIHPHCVHRPIVRVNEKYIDLHIEHKVKILQIA